MAESRRSFFGCLPGLITAPFLAKVVTPVNLDGQFFWDQRKPFAELPEPISAMEAITSNAGGELLLVVSGGNGYLVNQHGVAKRLY